MSTILKDSRQLTAEQALEGLCLDRELVTVEIHKPNAFYGHATQVKQGLGLNPHSQLKVMLAHGIAQHRRVWQPKLKSPLPMLLCPGQPYAEYFQHQTGKLAYAVGPMLQYMPGYDDALKLPEERTLVVFPNHSTHYQETEYDFGSVFDLIDREAINFDRVKVCLYWKDVQLGHHKHYLDRGVEVVSAGHMFDPNFGQRLIQILGQASETIAMAVGTNLFYAILMGRPSWVQLVDEKRTYLSAEQKNTLGPFWDEGDKIRAEAMSLFGERTGEITPEQRDFADRLAGVSIRKSKAEMLEYLNIAQDLFSRKIVFPVKKSTQREGQHPDANLPDSNSDRPAQSMSNTGGEEMTDHKAVHLQAQLRSAMEKVNTKPDEALVILREVIQVADKLPGIRLLMALAYARLGKNELARGEVERELEINPNNADARLFLQKLDESKLDVDHQKQQTPNESASGDEAAQALSAARDAMKRGDLKSARTKIFDLKASFGRLQGLDELRGDLFLRDGQEDAARESYLEELRWFAENESARQKLEKLTTGTQPQTTLGDDEFKALYAKIKPYTMLTEERLFAIYSLSRQICTLNLPGNFVECGVAGGGATAILAHVIKTHSKVDRKIYACDTYEGMPAPGEKDVSINSQLTAHESGWGEGTCAAPVGSVREACRLVGAEDVLVPVKGMFEETLPAQRSEISSIAFLHADSDWYESQKTIFENLFDLVAPGGVIQVDDYGFWGGSRKAIDEYLGERGVKVEMQPIDGNGVWFQKP
jgi:predicted O-methyltransferase YrrM